MSEVWNSSTLLFLLLNPFSMSIYLSSLIEDLDRRTFRQVLMRGTLIATSTFILFAWVGDAIFTDILQARFAAFLIFGGIVFLVMGVRLVFNGAETFRMLRGDPEHLGGTIAMPFMIGPGTVSASIVAGGRLDPAEATLSIVIAMAGVLGGLLVVKRVFDAAQHRNPSLVRRYTEMVGRITALILGTIAVEMVLQGIEIFLGLR